MKTKRLLWILAVALIGLQGCKDKDDDIEVPIEPDPTEDFQPVQSMTYVSTTADEHIVIPEGSDPQSVVIAYQVQPTGMATVMAAHQELLSFTIEEVLTNPVPSTSASLPVLTVTADAEGLLLVTTTPAGFETVNNYAVALHWDNSPYSYTTDFTPVRIKFTIPLHDQGEEQGNAE